MDQRVRDLLGARIANLEVEKASILADAEFKIFNLQKEVEVLNAKIEKLENEKAGNEE